MRANEIHKSFYAGMHGYECVGATAGDQTFWRHDDDGFHWRFAVHEGLQQHGGLADQFCVYALSKLMYFLC